jgi:hypothetical protein
MRKHLVCIILFLSISVSVVISQRTEELTIEKGNKLYGIIEKKTTIFNEENIIERIELILTDEASRKNGFTKQIVYFKDGKESAYEMLQNNEIQNNTGVLKRIEYIDLEDKVVQIDLVFENDVKYILKEKLVSLVEKFPVYTLAYYKRIFEETDPQEGVFSIEGPIYSGMANIVFTNEKKEITEKEKELIRGWQKAHHLDDYSNLFTYKILINESDMHTFMLIQDSLLDDLVVGDNVLVQYYYIGGYGLDPMYLITGYIEQ